MSGPRSGLAAIVMAIGLCFDLLGCLGLVRLPDVYNRLQASTKCVTLGTFLILTGVVILYGFGAMGWKALLCLWFVAMTSPTAAHAIGRRGPPRRRSRCGRSRCATSTRRTGGGGGGAVFGGEAGDGGGSAMKWPKLRELKEAVTSFVKGPYTHPFPAEATPIPDNIRGKPVYHEEKCIGCGACAEVCPARAIESRGDGAAAAGGTIGSADSCCTSTTASSARSACGAARRRKASRLEGVRAVGLSRAEMQEVVEKEMVLCELCGKGIGPGPSAVDLPAARARRPTRT